MSSSLAPHFSAEEDCIMHQVDVVKKIFLTRARAKEAGGRRDIAAREKLYSLGGKILKFCFFLFMTARVRQAGKRRDNAAKEFFNHGATT